MATDKRDEPLTEFFYCYGAITETLKFGPTQLHSGHKVLFLIIPGNPGLVGFYRTFMQTLHSTFGYRHPVWAVSQGGHCVPPPTMDMVQDASWEGAGDIFGLDGQIEHKLAFLRKQVPRETSLILVGHSIGCHIILEMMKRDPELKVMKAVMLFPTIERMAQTPQGKVMTPVLHHMRYIFYPPIFLLTLLPESFKASMIKWVFRGIRSLDPTVLEPTVSLFNDGDSGVNAMYMGGQEMQKVVKRDDKTISENLEKIVFFYGATDHWCPIEYYHDMKQDFPNADIRLCENGFRHAFVLDTPREVAALVVEAIKDLRI